MTKNCDACGKPLRYPVEVVTDTGAKLHVRCAKVRVSAQKAQAKEDKAQDELFRSMHAWEEGR